MRRTLAVALLCLWLTAPARAADPAVDLSIVNAGPGALRCLILFGHWVTQDIGPIAPGARMRISMRRGEPPGALYIPRFDGRKMMIENILCGAAADWAATSDQIPLQPVRAATAGRFQTSCQLAAKVACSMPAEKP